MWGLAGSSHWTRVMVGDCGQKRNHTALAAWTENSGPCTGKKMSWTLWSSHLKLFSHLPEMVMISWGCIASRVQWVLSYCVHTDTRTIGTIEHTALWNSLPWISITDLRIHDGRNSGNPWLRLSHPESKGPDSRRCSPVCSCWCRVDWHLGTQVFYFTPRILILHGSTWLSADRCQNTWTHPGTPGTSRPWPSCAMELSWGYLHGFIITGFTQPYDGMELS